MNARYRTNIAGVKKPTPMVTMIVECMSSPAPSTQRRNGLTQTRIPIATSNASVPHVATFINSALLVSQCGGETMSMSSYRRAYETAVPSRHESPASFALTVDRYTRES